MIEQKTIDKNVLVDFDWDFYDSGMKIPKYQDISEEYNRPIGKFDGETMDKFKNYEGKYSPVSINKGSVVSGRVIQITEKDITFDINNKDNVVIDRRGSEEPICKQLEINQEIDILINNITDKPYMIKGSLSDLVRSNVKVKMKDYYIDNEVLTAYVRECIPAGYLLDIEIDNIKVDAFMPNTLADVNKLYDPTILVGKKINVILETPQQDKDIYIVSRKKYLKTLIPQKIKELGGKSRDTLYEGVVTGSRKFGVFVQFNECLTGMIHKANVAKGFQDKIEQIKPGTKIEFYIKDVIKGGDQIILTQNLNESLWDKIRVGDKIDGKVIAVKPFGALIALDYETNGLIQTTYINKNKKKLSAGDKINVTVIHIIRDERKTYLTFSDDTETINRLNDKSSNSTSDIDKLKDKFNNK